MKIRSAKHRIAKRAPFLALMLCVFGLSGRSSGQPSAEPSPKAPVRTITLSIEGKPATEAVIWVGDQKFDHSDIALSPMLRALTNIAGHLDARALATLRRSFDDPIELVGAKTPLATVRLMRSTGSVEHPVVRMASGQIMLLDQEEQSLGRMLDPAIFAEIGLDLSVFNGTKKLDPREPIRAELRHFQSAVLLEPKLRKVRFKHNYPQLTRDLDHERYRIRLPVAQSTAQPTTQATDQQPGSLPGVLIWISPTPSGQIPGMFSKACDELNLIAVGVDNNGNGRELTDRLQNHFDSLATVAAHYQIDERRVYVTGMSGGGRCSSILQLAFPDVFTGAVPIVGLDSYHKTPTGERGMFWPARQGRPDARWFKMLADRRIAAITGTMDFNAPEMRKRTQQMKDDRIVIRLDVIEGMGHTMPSPDQFLDALSWVDELQQENIKEHEDKAMQLLDRIKKQHERRRDDQPLAQSPAARKQLIRITIDAPWSPAAWEAAQILGIEH